MEFTELHASLMETLSDANSKGVHPKRVLWADMTNNRFPELLAGETMKTKWEALLSAITELHLYDFVSETYEDETFGYGFKVSIVWEAARKVGMFNRPPFC